MLITHDVEEAIHVADRILVLSSRPTHIQATFDVPFAHPRKLSSPPAQALRVAILRELGVEQDETDAPVESRNGPDRTTSSPSNLAEHQLARLGT